MSLTTNKKYWVLIVFLIGLLLPITSYAQSEEDVLNSIGSELSSEADKKKAAEKANKEYEALKPKADAAYKAKKYAKAKEYYEQMLKLKPDSDFASSRLALIDQKIAEAKEAQLEKQYNDYIAKADALLVAENWTEAEAQYQLAAKVYPNEAYPKQQIQKIAGLKAEAEKAAKLAAVQKKYDDAIAKADAARDAQNWEVATQQYNVAKKVKPEETYPGQQIAAVAKLKAAAEAKAAQEALDKKYAVLIKMGDDALAEKNWAVAKEKYKLAMDAKPTEAYAKNQYNAVDGLKAKHEAELEAERVDRAYKMQISKADEAFNNKDWDNAVLAYQKAKELKPSETYPGSKIKEANQMIADEAEAKRKAAEEETQFQAKVSEGEGHMAKENWEAAIASLTSALSLRPKDSRVNQLLTTSKSNKKKADDLALKEKAAEEARQKTQQQFDYQMEQGKQALAQKDWMTAGKSFNEAKKLIPDSNEPDQQLAELQRLKKQEEDRIAAEKAKKEEEERLAAEAKAAEEARLAAEAKAVEEARLEAERQKKEAERLAKEAAEAEEAKRKEAERLAAAAAAEALAKEKEAQKEAERIAKEKEAERIRAEKEAAQKAEAEAAELAAANRTGFNKSVKEYQSLIKEKQWTDAENALNRAEEFVPNQPEVQSMRTELRKLRAAEDARIAQELSEKKAAEQSQKKYDELIKNGDRALASGNLDESMKLFESALELKREDYPKNKIREIEELKLAQDQEALERQKEIDREYGQLLSDGEQFIVAKEYQNAIESFEKAAKLKPENQGPKERIKAVNDLIKKEKELEERRANLEVEYKDAIKQGDVALKSKDFAGAKQFFLNASKLKPAEELPKEKLEETKRLWAEKVAEDKAAEAERMAAQKEQQYSDAIAKGDLAMGSENWDEAISQFQKALQAKTGDSYASEQLNEAKSKKTEALAVLEQQRQEEIARQKALEAERLAKEQEAQRLAQLEEDFQNYLSMGKSALNEQEYKTAVAGLKKALEIKPDHAEAQSLYDQANAKFQEQEAQRIALEKERARLAAIELKKRQEKARKEREAYLAELMKNSPSELAKRYPDGLSQEIDEETERVVTKSVIVENGEGRYLIKFEYPWGETFYYLNGKKIREDAYEWNIRKYKF